MAGSPMSSICREARSAEARLNRLALDDAEVQMATGFAEEIRAAMASLGRRPVEALDPAGVLAELDRAADALSQGDTAPLVAALPGFAALSARASERLHQASPSMERAMTATGQVLEYAEIGRMTAGDHRVPLESVLQKLVDAAAADLQAGSIEMQVNVPPGLLLPLREEHAAVILRHLLTNARDAVRSAPASGERRIALGANVAHGKIDVTVRDTGVGMSAAAQQRVFQPFFTTKGAHTGLGLGLSRKLARLYGGELAFSSEEGQGTTFTFTLPARD